MRDIALTQHFLCAELEELVTRAKRIALTGTRSLGSQSSLEATRTFRIEQRTGKE